MKISQSDLGAKIGISYQQVQKYEKGINRVGASRLTQIAEALELPVLAFYEVDDRGREVESLLSHDTGGSLRLLRAYSRLKEPTVRRHIVALVEALADQHLD